MLALLAILVAVLAGVLSSMDEDHRSAARRGDENDAATTTEASTVTTTSVTTTTAAAAGPPLGPPLGQPVSASLVYASVEDGWFVLDLGSGELRALDLGRFDGAEPWAAVPVSGGVVTRSFSNAVLIPLQGESVLLQRDVASVVGDGGGDGAWLLRFGPQSMDLVKVAPTAEVLVGPFDLPVFGDVATTSGLVTERGGRAYLHAVDGVRYLGVGAVFDAAGSAVLLQTCDEAGRCGFERIDVEADARVRYEWPVSSQMQRGNAVLSPDGQLALLSYVGDTEHLQTFAPDGSAAWGINALLLDGSVEWLPDDLGVVALDETSNRVMWSVPVSPVRCSRTCSRHPLAAPRSGSSSSLTESRARQAVSVAGYRSDPALGDATESPASERQSPLRWHLSDCRSNAGRSSRGIDDASTRTRRGTPRTCSARRWQWQW